MFCQIILGLTFMFSGFVKGIDPLGTAYKLGDYFHAFHMEFLEPLALTFSVLLNTSEFVLGASLVLGLIPGLFAKIAFGYMCIFTPLALALAVYDPVTDCGCFGDAIVMTNWQTFIKNIVILALSVYLVVNRRSLYKIHKLQRTWFIVTALIVLFLGFSIYEYRHLPLIDFRPYKVGVNIPEAMETPPGMPVDSFQTILVYEKEGVLKEFTIDKIPWQDDTWNWVETKSVLVKEGYHPPIHDFAFTNIDGDDITDSLLSDQSYSLLAIAYKLDKASRKGLDKLSDIYDYAQANNLNFYLATATTAEDIAKYRDSLGYAFPYYFADEIMLKTVARSNPGLVLLKSGTILGKWHFNDYPSTAELSEIIAGSRLEQTNKSGRERL